MNGYKIGWFIGWLVISVALIVGIVLSLVACTTQEDIELAKMRRDDAEARLAASEAQGTVNVLREQANVHMESLRTEADITKEMRDYELELARREARLHREEMASLLSEYQTVIVALKENRTIAENSRAAAENSFWVLPLAFRLSE